MLLMSVKESGRKYGITVEGEATDLGSYKGKSLRFDCGIVRDCKTRSKQMFRCWQFTNLLDKAEIEEKIRPYLNK